MDQKPIASTDASSCACCAPTAASSTRTAEAGRTAGGAQEIRIAVQGGYSPASVQLRRGVPARLVFDRQEASRCSEELLIPALGVKQVLPQGEQTVIEFTPREIGTFAFTCGMRMLRGEIVVS